MQNFLSNPYGADVLKQKQKTKNAPFKGWRTPSASTGDNQRDHISTRQELASSATQENTYMGKKVTLNAAQDCGRRRTDVGGELGTLLAQSCTCTRGEMSTQTNTIAGLELSPLAK